MKALTRTKTTSTGLARVSVEPIERRIFLIRGQRVMLDSDLAALYHVATKVFNQAVRRNQDRFPSDFMFQLTVQEVRSLRSQFVTLDNSSTGRGRHRKYAPYVFTEHGIAMLSSVLRSKRAVQMNIMIVRAFIRLREMLAENKALATRVAKLEAQQKQNVSVIRMLIDEIADMKNPPLTDKRRIGFRIESPN
jgi:hypothetical protein